MRIKKIKEELDTELEDMSGDLSNPETIYGQEDNGIFEKKIIHNGGDHFVTKVKIDDTPTDSVEFELAVAGKLSI